jgi:hypothetical protein
MSSNGTVDKQQQLMEEENNSCHDRAEGGLTTMQWRRINGNFMLLGRVDSNPTLMNPAQNQEYFFIFKGG